MLMKFYKIILFGGNRLLELTPFDQIIRYLKKNISFLIITDKLHLEKVATRILSTFFACITLSIKISKTVFDFSRFISTLPRSLDEFILASIVTKN